LTAEADNLIIPEVSRNTDLQCSTSISTAHPVHILARQNTPIAYSTLYVNAQPFYPPRVTNARYKPDVVDNNDNTVNENKTLPECDTDTQLKYAEENEEIRSGSETDSHQECTEEGSHKQQVMVTKRLRRRKRD
jgi:hypothetical protein